MDLLILISKDIVVQLISIDIIFKLILKDIELIVRQIMLEVKVLKGQNTFIRNMNNSRQ